MIPTPEDIVKVASKAAFDKPLVMNVQRAVLVEAMISMALEPDWRWYAASYELYDFKHLDGTRLEVKQTAARLKAGPAQRLRQPPPEHLSDLGATSRYTRLPLSATSSK